MTFAANDNERVIGTLVIGVAALMVLPVAAPAAATNLARWMVSERILALAGDSVISIPGCDAGLDLNRIGLLVCSVIIGVILYREHRRDHA